MKKIIIILFLILPIAGGVYYYTKIMKPDLIISSVVAVNKSGSPVNITVKNIGKTAVTSPIYICILDAGSQRYLKSGGEDLTCGHTELVNLDASAINGSIKSIGINESIMLPIPLDGYFGPLIVMVDRTDENSTNNLVKESKEYNNSVFLYSSDKGWELRGEI